MNKDYSILDELIPKTQELHRAIFDKRYEQGKTDVLDKIREEILSLTNGDIPERIWNVDVLNIIDKYREVSE